jgi:hypothetical protein
MCLMFRMVSAVWEGVDVSYGRATLISRTYTTLGAVSQHWCSTPQLRSPRFFGFGRREGVLGPRERSGCSCLTPEHPLSHLHNHCI